MSVGEFYLFGRRARLEWFEVTFAFGSFLLLVSRSVFLREKGVPVEKLFVVFAILEWSTARHHGLFVLLKIILEGKKQSEN